MSGSRRRLSSGLHSHRLEGEREHGHRERTSLPPQRREHLRSRRRDGQVVALATPERAGRAANLQDLSEKLLRARLRADVAHQGPVEKRGPGEEQAGGVLAETFLAEHAEAVLLVGVVRIDVVGLAPLRRQHAAAVVEPLRHLAHGDLAALGVAVKAGAARVTTGTRQS